MNPDEQQPTPEKPSEEPVTLTEGELNDGKPCPDCGEVHDATFAKHDIEALVAKHTKRYRVLVGGYFASIAFGLLGSFMAFGWGGPVMSLSAFGIFFFHTNMGYAAGGLDQLKQAVTLFDQKEAAAASGKTAAGSGLYL